MKPHAYVPTEHTHDHEESAYEPESCPKCVEDGPPDSFADRELARERREHPEWFDHFD